MGDDDLPYDDAAAQKRRAQTAPAREAVQEYAALRALDDPVRLAKAARIIRMALERRRLRLADLGVDLTRESA